MTKKKHFQQFVDHQYSDGRNKVNCFSRNSPHEVERCRLNPCCKKSNWKFKGIMRKKDDVDTSKTLPTETLMEEMKKVLLNQTEFQPSRKSKLIALFSMKVSLSNLLIQKRLRSNFFTIASSRSRIAKKEVYIRRKLMKVFRLFFIFYCNKELKLCFATLAATECYWTNWTSLELIFGGPRYYKKLLSEQLSKI